MKIHLWCGVTDRFSPHFPFLVVGGPQLTSVCTAIYFNIYTLYGLIFIPPNFSPTRALTTKNVIFGVLTLDPLISTNITSRLVPKIWSYAPGHCACRRTISSLSWSLYHLQIWNNSFHQNRTSLWMRRHRNHHPFGSLWESLHHCIISNSRGKGFKGEGCHCEYGDTRNAVKSSV